MRHRGADSVAAAAGERPRHRVRHARPDVRRGRLGVADRLACRAARRSLDGQLRRGAVEDLHVRNRVVDGIRVAVVVHGDAEVAVLIDPGGREHRSLIERDGRVELAAWPAHDRANRTRLREHRPGAGRLRKTISAVPCGEPTIVGTCDEEAARRLGGDHAPLRCCVTRAPPVSWRRTTTRSLPAYAAPTAGMLASVTVSLLRSPQPLSCGMYARTVAVRPPWAGPWDWTPV